MVALLRSAPAPLLHPPRSVAALLDRLKVFLEEEREREMEASFDAELDESERKPRTAEDQVAGIDEALHNESADGSAALAGRRTLDSVKAAERLMEALETALDEEKAIAMSGDDASNGGGAHRANPLMMGLAPAQFVLRSLQMIKAPELEQSLLVLPFHLVELLCTYLVQLLQSSFDVELCARCAIFMVRIHQAQVWWKRVSLFALRPRASVRQTSRSVSATPAL